VKELTDTVKNMDKHMSFNMRLLRAAVHDDDLKSKIKFHLKPVGKTVMTRLRKDSRCELKYQEMRKRTDSILETLGHQHSLERTMPYRLRADQDWSKPSRIQKPSIFVEEDSNSDLWPHIKSLRLKDLQRDQ